MQACGAVALCVPRSISVLDCQVSHIDVTKQSPCAWGRVICFSIYGGPEVDFRKERGTGEPQNMLWVDTMLDDKVPV